MEQFAELITKLEQASKTTEKERLLVDYFWKVNEEDKLWAVALFTGKRPKRQVTLPELQSWALQVGNIPDWLFDESYAMVGDLAETISLILPEPELSSKDQTLAYWMNYINSLAELTVVERQRQITAAWEQLTSQARLIFNKLIIGNFRVGIAANLIFKSLAQAIGMDQSVVAHRLMGEWQIEGASISQLFASSHSNLALPYPFHLAHQLDQSLENLGDTNQWFAEWKWDGLRAQIICRQGQLVVWSRSEEILTDKFPEFGDICNALQHDVVLDGELITYKNGCPLPYHSLQNRITRKKITKEIMQSDPAVFMVYDLLELDGEDLRSQPLQERHHRLLQMVSEVTLPSTVMISPHVEFTDWSELQQLQQTARSHGAEGLMLKNINSIYKSGRNQGEWWKWKLDPYTVDAVLLYAQVGQGQTEYTFGVWDEDRLVPFTKSSSGLTAEEIAQVDEFIRDNTQDKFGPVRAVKPQLVFEISFDGIQLSTRHKSGILLRSPRILRWRHDKKPGDADQLSNLFKLLNTP